MVLSETVLDVQASLAGRELKPWARLTGATVNRCVLRFAFAYHAHADDVAPELACSSYFHEYADQLLTDSTGAEWGVAAYLMPVVAGIVENCGRTVVDRMNDVDC